MIRALPLRPPLRWSASLIVAALVFGDVAAEPVTVIDQRGKTVTLEGPATRVMTIAIPLFWTYLTVDGSDAHVIGANAVASAQMRDGIMDRVFRRSGAVATNVTRDGTFVPNVETLLAMRPDAVFQWADRGDELVNALDRIGLRTLGVKNTGREGDIEAWITMSGAVAGKPERAEIVRRMRDGNRRFESLTASLAHASRPRVLMLTEYSKQITPNGPDSYVDLVVARAGGLNVATVDRAVNIEQVLAWDPEVKLTPFRGHLILTEGGVRHADPEAPVSGGVPPTDGRTGAGWALADAACA